MWSNQISPQAVSGNLAVRVDGEGWRVISLMCKHPSKDRAMIGSMRLVDENDSPGSGV
jgi:hypothetical protein